MSKFKPGDLEFLLKYLINISADKEIGDFIQELKDEQLIKGESPNIEITELGRRLIGPQEFKSIKEIGDRLNKLGRKGTPEALWYAYHYYKIDRKSVV